MSFEPQKFFIGLMDFFSILLPGALLTFLLKDEVRKTGWVSEGLSHVNDAKGWVAFLVASYLLGHFAFLIGSWLDELYDWLRRRTLNTQIKRLVLRGKPIPWGIRWLVWLIFKRERDLAVDRVGKIKEKSLSPLQAKKTINNFQWSKALLTVESPDSLSVVQRFEADSKFFRCFVIVLLVLLVLAWRQHHIGLAIVAAILLPFSWWRYMEQRYKATNQAYWSVITLTARHGKVFIGKAPRANSSLTHAGGVVFRKRGSDKAEYLLVEASKDPTRWVLPKGKIEDNEDIRETAVREVHEETGVWARICEDLGLSSYSDNGEQVTTQIYLMERAARGFPTDRNRKSRWLTLEMAKERATHPETSKLLELAEQHRRRL